VARNYSENLREEVKKGMQEKASQGIYPGRPPFGYRNNGGTRSIEIHPEKAAIAERIFELVRIGPLFAFGALEDHTGGERGEDFEDEPSQDAHESVLHGPIRVGRKHVCGDTPPAHTPAVVFQCAISAAGEQQAKIREAGHCISRASQVRARQLHCNGGTQERQICVLPMQRGTGAL
jgi:hypothetical protein